jgi:branched-chain amino acid transport system substrate-binding protein
MALVLSLGILAGCGGAKAPTTPAAPAAPAEKVIKIGVIAPMTGDVKTFGESTKNGFDLAIQQAGLKAGDYKVVAVYGDDKNDPTEGVNVATKMINQDKVQAIVGSVSSKVSIPISEVANANKIPMITGTSTNTKVTVDEKGVVKPYIFRACFIDPFQGLVAAKFVTENLKLKTAAIMYDKGNDYTVGLAEQFKLNFEKAGGKVVAMESYGKDDADFNAVLTNIAAKKPEMLYLPDYYNKVNLIAKQALAKGLKVPMMGGDGWDSGDLDFVTLDGMYFTNHYSEKDTRPEVQNFVKTYGEKYKDKDGKPAVPDALAALAFDATNILLQGVKVANSNDGTKIKDAIKALNGFPSVSGKVSFDASNNPVKAAAILQVKKDKTYGFVTTVNP